MPYLFSHLSQAFVHRNTFAFVRQNNVFSFYSHLRRFVRVSLHERGAQCSTSHFVSSLPCLRTLFPVHVRPRSCVNVKCALNLLRRCHRLSRRLPPVVHAALQCFQHALGWDRIGVVVITHPFSTLSPTTLHPAQQNPETRKQTKIQNRTHMTVHLHVTTHNSWRVCQ